MPGCLVSNIKHRQAELQISLEMDIHTESIISVSYIPETVSLFPFSVLWKMERCDPGEPVGGCMSHHSDSDH